LYILIGYIYFPVVLILLRTIHNCVNCWLYFAY